MRIRIVLLTITAIFLTSQTVFSQQIKERPGLSVSTNIEKSEDAGFCLTLSSNSITAGCDFGLDGIFSHTMKDPDELCSTEYTESLAKIMKELCELIKNEKEKTATSVRSPDGKIKYKLREKAVAYDDNADTFSSATEMKDRLLESTYKYKIIFYDVIRKKVNVIPKLPVKYLCQ